MMTRRAQRGAIAALAVLAFLAVSSPMLGQGQALTGNIFGHVLDEQGGRLPGVTITLTGAGAPQTATTDARGEYRFVNIPPGSRYILTFDLEGFVKVTKTDVQVAVGQNTGAPTTLRLAAVEAAVTVRGEAPLMETRKVGANRTVDQVELQAIPTARDPWVVLQASGVLTDRLNVGGNQSGQQSNMISKGSGREQAVWNIDGVSITDMGALGASPTYYDFDSFEEMQFSTGGSDLANVTPGVQINLVTKRGTNDVHGSARVYLADDPWQSSNLPAEVNEARFPNGGNRVAEVLDYGIEAGGPLWKDRAWLWGAYGRNEIKLLTIAGTADNTTLEGINGKLNLQIFEGTAVTGFYSRDDKLKFGRDAGVTRPAPTSYNQSGPAIIHKAEVSQVFSSRLFATATYAYVHGGFGLTPQAGLALDAFRDAALIWGGSYSYYETKRPQHQAGVNSSYFFNTGPAGHELKFGFQYRQAPVTSASGWPGSQNVGYLDNSGNFARLTRGVESGIFQEYYNAFLGDTMTWGDLTVNFGVRYDLQRGNPEGATVLQNDLRPDLLPGFSAPAGEQAFEWEDVSPRVGATYVVGDARKLLLKASYAVFADQLGAGTIFNTNAAPGISYLEYPWTDSNGDRRVQLGEVDFANRRDAVNIDFNNPTSVSVFNRTDPDLEAGKTDEIIVGVDYEVMSDLVIGSSYTYREYEKPTWTNRNGLTRNDFIPVTDTAILNAAGNGLTGTLFNGQSYDIRDQVFRLRPGTAVPSGLLLDNRTDWKSTFNGVDFSLTKRLSNKWMARLNAGWGSGEQENGFDGCVDPNNVLNTNLGVNCAGSDIIARRSAGSGDFSNVFIHSRWQANLAGMYELPWDFNIGMNLFAREGYPFPSWTQVNPSDGLGARLIVIGKLDDQRHDDVYNLDLRLGKVVNVGILQLNLSLDVFNVLNENTVLQRQGRVNITFAGQSDYGTITEIQAPRLVRVGARVSF